MFLEHFCLRKTKKVECRIRFPGVVEKYIMDSTYLLTVLLGPARFELIGSHLFGKRGKSFYQFQLDPGSNSGAIWSKSRSQWRAPIKSKVALPDSAEVHCSTWVITAFG